MSLLHGKQLRDQSTSLGKLSGTGLVTFTESATMSFAAGSVLRQADENILIGTDVVNKNYVDAVAQGLHIKQAVKAISLEPITLSGVQTIDGFTLSIGDRVLVNGQGGLGTASPANGIYVVATGSWTRALDTDGDPANEVEEGDFTFVAHGDTYESTGWVLGVTDAADHSNILVGTESQLWIQFSSAGIVEAGDGLSKTGNTLDVEVGTGLEINLSNEVAIADTGVSAGNYGTAGSVGTFTVNAQGQITSAQDILIDISSTQINDFSTAVDTVIFDSANFVDGETIDFTVLGATGVSAEVTLGSLTASRFDIINAASASQGWKLGYNTSGQFEWFDPTLSDISEVVAGAGLTGGGDSGSVTLDVQTTNGVSIIGDSVGLGGTLSQNTTIDGGGFDLTIGNVDVINMTSSNVLVQTDVFDVEANGLIILDAGTGSVQILADDDVTISASSSINIVANGDLDITFTNSSITDTSNGEGLVYSADYSGTFVTNSLISKLYVDNAISTLGSATINGVTAGAGLSGGGTANYITLDVNLGVNSGLTFSGDDIIIDTNIAGNGLDFASGVLTVNTSEITGALAGNGLTANGSTLDVNVNADSLEIVGDVIRLKDTVTGDRTFQNSVTIQGDLIVEGTQSIINTENIYIEDNIITLNATYSGPYNVVDAGIEANLGGGTFAALIWDASENLWAAGFSGSTSTIITEAGTGLTKSGNTLSIDTTGFATTLAGNGLTANAGALDVNVDTTSIVITGDVLGLAPTVSNGVTFSGSFLVSNGGTINNGLTVSGGSTTDTLTVTSTSSFTGLATFGSVTGSSAYFTTSLQTPVVPTVGDDVINLTYFGASYSQLQQQIDNIDADFITAIEVGAGLTVSSATAGTASISILDTTAGNGLTFSNGVYDVNTSNGLTIIGDSVQVADTIAGSGLTFSSGVIDVNTGLGLEISGDDVAMVWGGTSTGLTFSNNGVSANVDGTTIIVNNDGKLAVSVDGFKADPVYQIQTGVESSGATFATSVFLSATPSQYSRVQVFVNGLNVRLGSGTALAPAYFENGSIRTLDNLDTTCQLIWNSTIAGYQLEGTDQIEIVYEA